jgi:hypothetical protein
MPAGHPGVSIGFFFIELAEVLARFEDDYDFVLARPSLPGGLASTPDRSAIA